MKFKTYLSFSTVLLIIIAILFGCSNEVQQEKSSFNSGDKMPEDFNFSLSYGTYGKQKIDTFTNTVVKDLVLDGTIEANLELAKEDMKVIYNELIKINMMDDDFEIVKDEGCHEEPPSYTSWKIQMNGKIKNISYAGAYCNKVPEEILQLAQIKDYIHNLVAETHEYKQLPEPNSSYE